MCKLQKKMEVKRLKKVENHCPRGTHTPGWERLLYSMIYINQTNWTKNSKCYYLNNYFSYNKHLILGIHQTIQKNSVGFIPWDGITVGKDRIPLEKDWQSVLFYAPTPNFFTTLSVFIRFWCFLPFWNQETKPKTLRINLRQSD